MENSSHPATDGEEKSVAPSCTGGAVRRSGRRGPGAAHPLGGLAQYSHLFYFIYLFAFLFFLFYFSFYVFQKLILFRPDILKLF
jgi:hypothetical protein